MKARRLTVMIATAALTMSAGALADEIYKWTDEEGTVHYGDRPTGAPTEERLSMTYNRTDGSAVRSRVQARQERQAQREEQKSVAAAAAQEAADNEAAAAQRERACENARARLESYLQSRRLYRTDENGERVYLDDTERQEARKRAEDQVTEFCS